MEKKKVIGGRSPYSDAVKVGNTIYVAGQIPKDAKTGKWADNIKEQTKTCLEKIKINLNKFDAKVSDIVKITIFLTDIKEYAKMNEGYIEFFKENGVEKDFPVRSTAEVGPLMFQEWKIEIDAIAVQI